LPRRPRKSNFKVPPTFENFYAVWRMPPGAATLLRDANDMPPERLLQAIWQHQHLRRDRLKTADGKTVRILHPGFISAEGGPDFQGAVVQIGDGAPRSGDVEVDLRADGWHAHGHDCNPSFQNVILHVIWEEARQRADAPVVLSLKNSLDAPLEELSVWFQNESPRALPKSCRGRCSSSLQKLNGTQLAELLTQASRVRLQAKAAQFRACARQSGWEQALWEGLFRALGYKHNVWPMQNLAESRLRWASGTASAFAVQARLLGISGLLPMELTRLRPAARDSGAAGRAAQKSADGYLRKLWDCWWREREVFDDCILPRTIWKFHGLRPANHPQRRLALAAHWIASGDLVQKLERWCAAEILDGRAALLRGQADRQVSPAKLVDSLRKIFEVKHDEFWSWHWTFRSAHFKKPQLLLGNALVTNLAVNVILPWLWTRAIEGKNGKLQRIIEQRYLAWPPAGDNSVLRLARQRLLGDSGGRVLRNAAAQQGLMQIVRDFCGHSNAMCEHCRFPELIREFPGWKTT
jgi:hypothetical protein